MGRQNTINKITTIQSNLGGGVETPPRVSRAEKKKRRSRFRKHRHCSNMETAAEVSQDNKFATDSDAATIQERIQKRNQARIEDVERRKEAKEIRSVPEEKGEYFSRTFRTELACIEELLSRCSGADRAEVIRRLEETSTKTAQLQKFVNDSLLFLTQYELRQAQAALQKLQSSISEARDKALPKKKFAFRARTNDAVPPGADTPAESGKADGGGGALEKSPPGAATSEGANGGGAAATDQCGFSNMDGELLTKTAEEIQKGDVLLTHLSNCKVRLFGSPSTLHLKHIDSCEILCGPVSTSVFVDHCKNSTLAFPCQQLRTHSTTDTQVYLHVTSRAIIEDCHGVSLAPFSWSYPTLDADFNVSGLDRDRNNWSQVDDFNWLAARTPSPNWAVIPEADRRTNWD
ncbi:tubulin-specific chaperone C [Paralichthys olivaceus]|uniref:tubulin-specific chaperone C n=1 Tax=Paralichthys olivaceus TaxID=8255 RepID=UPI00375260B1